MKRILVLSILLAATVAHADQAAPPVPGTPPAGWKADPKHAEVVQQGLLAGLPRVEGADARVHSYRSPEGGAQVIFSVVDVGVADDAAATAYVRTRVDDLKNTAQMMVDDGGGKARNLHWDEATDDKERVVEAKLEWEHLDNGTYSMVRAAWVKLAGAKGAVIEEVRAECLLASDRVEALRPTCTEVMASMMMIEAAARLPISAMVVEPAKPPTAADPPASMTATPPGTQVPARPVVEKTAERDWRAFYVLGALIIVAGVLMWNRRRREAYDQDAEEKKDEADAAEREEDA